ncbi:tetratricopeptide repeat [Brachionus plicatilis]|uniref:Tetratricopeptide repeat n=1 Tax=Brachionus plicatilis TaxID=10195 RepID=A0A3M7PJ34_BRAPC|nr:tetratricopeptide repeat [Brachionus plicatilis]
MERVSRDTRPFFTSYSDEDLNKTKSFKKIALWKTKQNEHKESLDNLFKTIDELKEISGEKQSSDNAKWLNIIGDIYLRMSECDKAFEYFNKSLQMTKTLNSDKSLELAAIYLSLGNYYSVIGDAQRSYDFGKMAYQIRKDMLGENSPLTADSVNNLAICLMNLEDSKNAEEFFLKYCEIWQKLSEDKPNKELADSWYNLGVFYEKSGNPHKSLEFFDKAYKTRNVLYVNSNHRDLVDSLSSLHHIYNQLDNRVKADEYAKLALRMNEKMEVEKNLKEADLLYSLGLAYQNCGDKNKALALLSQSYSIRKKIFPENHSLIKNLVDNMNKTNNSSDSNYSSWNYIQVFKWIEVNKINLKIVEIYLTKKIDGQFLKEFISRIRHKREIVASEIKDSSDEISSNDIEHFFRCLDTLDKNKNF